MERIDELQQLHRAVRELPATLEGFAYMYESDLKSVLEDISGLAQGILDDYFYEEG